MLLKEEFRILNCLRTDYDCASIVFNKYSDKWIVIRRNSNTIAVTLDSCMITFNRITILDLDKLCTEYLERV